jgi:hypothetical protein
MGQTVCGMNQNVAEIYRGSGRAQRAIKNRSQWPEETSNIYRLRPELAVMDVQLEIRFIFKLERL